MSRWQPVIVAVTAMSVAPPVFAQGADGSAAPVRTIELLSPVYTVDREYKSMMGPTSSQPVAFPEQDANPPEILWVTGFGAQMVGPDGTTPASQEYMCHSNLDFDPARHAALFNLPAYHTTRLFTLSQGQYEITMPPGFGLPYWSDETFKLDTQVLNLNDDGQTREVRHKITIEYVRDRDLTEPMKALFMTSGWGLVRLEGDAAVFGVEDPDVEMHGAGCLPGEAAGFDEYEDDLSRRFSGHWVVKPGREVKRTLVTKIMNLPYDTTIHAIAVHLHPFAESLELVDRTTGASVFRSAARQTRDKIGLEHVDSFSSVEGIPVFKDHEYELVSTYDNTTAVDQDSMAVMLLYLHDKRFEKRARPYATRVDGLPRLTAERVVLHTTQGDIEIGLYPDVAPHHVARFVRLARLGVYDTTTFFRVIPGAYIQSTLAQYRRGPALTIEQRAAIERLPAEFSDLEHRRGVVSMLLNDNADPNSAETSFCILLDDYPRMNERYTIFGEVLGGLDTLDRIAGVARDASNAPLEPVVIERAEVVLAPPPPDAARRPPGPTSRPGATSRPDG